MKSTQHHRRRMRRRRTLVAAAVTELTSFIQAAAAEAATGGSPHRQALLVHVAAPVPLTIFAGVTKAGDVSGQQVHAAISNP